MTKNKNIEDFKNMEFRQAFDTFRQETKRAIDENMPKLMENVTHTFSAFLQRLHIP